MTRRVKAAKGADVAECPDEMSVFRRLELITLRSAPGGRTTARRRTRQSNILSASKYSCTVQNISTL